MERKIGFLILSNVCFVLAFVCDAVIAFVGMFSARDDYHYAIIQHGYAIFILGNMLGLFLSFLAFLKRN
jgi:hypothetical protein